MSFLSYSSGQWNVELAKRMIPNWKDYFTEIVGQCWPDGYDTRHTIYFKGPPLDQKYAWNKGISSTLGHMNFVEQYACCGMVISAHTSLDQSLWGKGLGRKFLEIKEELAKHYGYSILQVTVCWTEPSGSRAEIHLLRTTPGWVHDYNFINRRTHNVVGVFHK